MFGNKLPRTRRFWSGAGALTLVLVAALFLFVRASGPASSRRPPVFSSNELWDAARTPPTSDQGWQALQNAAVTIAAAGSLTRLSGNGPKDQQWTQQADWVRHSQSLADAGLASLTAVRAKDRDALAKAGDQLVLSCINCHREYKVPAIWTERQLPPEEQKRP